MTKDLIIAVDGEGKNLPFPSWANKHPDATVRANGWHTYTLLAASDDQGRHKSIAGPLAERPAAADTAMNLGLSTVDCLEFHLKLPRNALVVGFYYSYDVVKMLADLPAHNLEQLVSGRVTPDYRERAAAIEREFGLSRKVIDGSKLAGNESTVWGKYCIQYTPRKKLHIIDLSAGREPDPREKGRRDRWVRDVIVWDVFGFFQQSFIKALRAAPGICDPAIIDRIESMKNQRGDFAKLSDAQIIEYCYEECYYLAKLVREMLEHFEKLGLRTFLNAYDGSGAVASAWMKREKIKDYKSETNLPFDIQLQAYFGGRFEAPELGYFPQLYSYDINSAYPYIISTLPCLAHGQFRELQPGSDGLVKFQPGKIGVYLAGSHTSGRFAPFPFRIDDARALANPGLISSKSVYYAHGGKRWIWSGADAAYSEIAVARKHFGADAIPLYAGWIWEPSGCGHEPFRQVPELYRTRKVLKGHGPGSADYDGAEKILKLLINSIYGKTVQSIGWQFGNDGKIKPPVNTSFIWGGLITSGTRAMILDAVMQGDIVSIATDGILSRTSLDDILPLSDNLGDWERDLVTDAYIFQSGVYRMLDDKGKEIYKTRGFASKEIPAQSLIDAWNTRNPDCFTVGPQQDIDKECVMPAEHNELELDPCKMPTRFMPVKSGIHRTSDAHHGLDYIGQWLGSNHKVTIAHNRRIPEITYDEFGLPSEVIGDTYNSEPVTFTDADISVPYTLKENWEDIEQDRMYMEGDYFEIGEIQ